MVQYSIFPTSRLSISRSVKAPRSRMVGGMIGDLPLDIQGEVIKYLPKEERQVLLTSPYANKDFKERVKEVVDANPIIITPERTQFNQMYVDAENSIIETGMDTEGRGLSFYELSIVKDELMSKLKNAVAFLKTYPKVASVVEKKHLLDFYEFSIELVNSAMRRSRY